MMSTTPLRISTITATGGINTPVDLKRLFDSIDIGGKAGQNGVLFLEYGRVKTERIVRGQHPRQPKSDGTDDGADAITAACPAKKQKKRSDRRFDNQTTIVLRVGESFVNMKVFGNGSLQMTGLKQIDDGPKAIHIVVDSIKAVPGLVDEPAVVGCVDFRVRMINSDFKIGFDVRRDHLYSLMLNEYGMRCSYEPCIYPGVKIEYYYNQQQVAQDGRCGCSDRGLSVKCSHCHKVTLVVFRSGSVIITGASTIAHLDAAHAFILAVLRTHREELEHVEYQQLTMDDEDDRA